MGNNVSVSVHVYVFTFYKTAGSISEWFGINYATLVLIT